MIKVNNIKSLFFGCMNLKPQCKLLNCIGKQIMKKKNTISKLEVWHLNNMLHSKAVPLFFFYILQKNHVQISVCICFMIE